MTQDLQQIELRAALTAVESIVRKGDAARLLDRLLRSACSGNLTRAENVRILRLAEYIVRIYENFQKETP